MHDGTIAQADTWLATNLTRYANWAVANNSLLIVTWDEDDNGPSNQIPTMIYGANVRPGTYAEPISHYNVLSTIEEMYGLPKTGLPPMRPPSPTFGPRPGPAGGRGPACPVARRWAAPFSAITSPDTTVAT